MSLQCTHVKGEDTASAILLLLGVLLLSAKTGSVDVELELVHSNVLLR